MGVAAAEIFAYLDQHRVLGITRHEVTCQLFSRLRHAMYSLVVGLRDDEAGDVDLSDHLRQLLSEWLTVPIPFEELHSDPLKELGSSTLVGIRWGNEVRQSLDIALESLTALQQVESPLRLQLAAVMRLLNTSGPSWRIYCHRSAARYFTTCAADVGIELGVDRFIHSLRDYRRVEPFDTMVKVGPLRTRGWGSFPNACVSAPRYRELVQVVWTGMADESGFGEDPLITPWVSMPPEEASAERSGPMNGRESTGGWGPAGQSWSRTVIAHADPTNVGVIEAPHSHVVHDELQEFVGMPKRHVPRRALLLYVGGGLGLFYPPQAEVLLLSPKARPEQALTRAVLSEVDPRGRFLIRADIGDVNLGAHNTDHGWYSDRWKAELKRQFEWHAEGLLRSLNAAGIRLRNLRECVEHWIQPASTVIHAPQQRRHFELLIEVLDMARCAPQPGRQRDKAGAWWRAAWREITASRGLAIQFGMQEQEIIGEEVEGIVMAVLPEVRDELSSEEPFRVAIPKGQSLEGSISFLPIHEVEAGFLVPDTLLKSMIKTSGAEEWRA